jgi:hypothetical protein
MRNAETTVCARLGETLTPLESDIVRVRRVGGETPSRGVDSSGWACVEAGKARSSESALLRSTVGRLRLWRRSREGYGGGGSLGAISAGSGTIGRGGSGDMGWSVELEWDGSTSIRYDGNTHGTRSAVSSRFFFPFSATVSLNLAAFGFFYAQHVWPLRSCSPCEPLFPNYILRGILNVISQTRSSNSMDILHSA